MKRLQLLLLYCCSSILAVTSCIQIDGYSCVSTYWDTISCVLNITDNPVGQSNTTYSLKFTELEEGDEFSCPLVVMNHSHSCVCKVTEGSETFSGYDQYDIKLCHEFGSLPVMKDFKPSENIQPTPPHEAEVKETPETFNITWKSGYDRHRYLKNVLDYELLLQTSHSTEILHPNSHETSVSIPMSRLNPDATYCVTVRSGLNHREYGGTWSKWSPSTCWKNEAGEEEDEEDNTLVILTKSLCPVCVVVGVLLFVFYSPTARMKIKTLSHTPSPAPFFQPLFQQHKGNLQEWLSPHGKFMLTYKTEEILTTEVVIVVPKPITKDPEENQDFHNPTVQPIFNQGQTCYVGLPGIHEASPPLPMICPGDTPYTQLPCSEWGVDIREADVASTPPQDFFNISSADSGCSCEDLTQSPECSSPICTVADSPPPCYSNDYCILNKTADGFAPVLVPKEGRLKVPSDSLQED